MSDLNQVVSHILEQLTQSRNDADQYSAELSKLYYEDELLQHFPVPKMDIGRVEIKMKVGLKEARIKQSIQIDIYQVFSERLAEKILNSVGSSDSEEIIIPKAEDLITDFHFTMISVSPELIDEEFKIDLGKAEELLNQSVYRLCFTTTPTDNPDLSILLNTISIQIRSELISLQNEVQELSQSASNLETTVEIDTEKLKTLPDSMISEMSLSTYMTNYQWVKDESGDSSNDQLIHLSQA